jgi:transcriptional regulator with GAF, ATPase, and Fis domain
MNNWTTYLLPIGAAFISLIVGLYNILYYARKSKWQREIFETYINTSKELDLLNMKMGELNDYEPFLMTLDNLLYKIKHMFDGFTGSDCRISISTIVEEDGLPIVHTLASIGGGQFIKREQFRVPVYEDISYRTILKSDGRAFVSNNLDKEYGWYSPEMTAGVRWKPDFLSIMSVPISKKTKKGEHIIGVLTIESTKKNAFDKSLHVKMVSSLALKLYSFIENSIEKRNKKHPS